MLQYIVCRVLQIVPVLRAITLMVVRADASSEQHGLKTKADKFSGSTGSVFGIHTKHQEITAHNASEKYKRAVHTSNLMLT